MARCKKAKVVHVPQPDLQAPLGYLGIDEATRAGLKALWPVIEPALPVIPGRLVHHRIGLEPRWYIDGYAFVLNAIACHLSGRHRSNGTTLARNIEAGKRPSC